MIISTFTCMPFQAFNRSRIYYRHRERHFIALTWRKKNFIFLKLFLQNKIRVHWPVHTITTIIIYECNKQVNAYETKVQALEPAVHAALLPAALNVILSSLLLCIHRPTDQPMTIKKLFFFHSYTCHHHFFVNASMQHFSMNAIRCDAMLSYAAHFYFIFFFKGLKAGCC